jgi:dihydrofolate reductase
MRKIILYIAISLDGKIAKPDGDVSWLDELPNPDHLDYGYADFLSSIDTTLMGNTTYKQLLGFGIEFPYRGKENYVFTRNKELREDENVKFISNDPVSFVKELKSREGGNIWLIGGGKLNTLLLNERLIDEMIIFVIPIVLGDGIPLFGNTPIESKLEMIKSKAYSNGVIELNYKINNA